MLFVAANFPHQEDRVQNQARDDQHEEDDAEDQHRHLPPVENHPADALRRRQRDQAGPERYEEIDRFAIALNAHLHRYFKRSWRLARIGDINHGSSINPASRHSSSLRYKVLRSRPSISAARDLLPPARRRVSAT